MQNPYGLAALIKHGGAVTWAVLGLLIMSLGVLVHHLHQVLGSVPPDQGCPQRREEFLGRRLRPRGCRRLPKDDDFRVIAESAIRAAAHHEGRLGDRISLRDWLAMALTRSVDSLNGKLSAGLSFLATVGSTAPFVGLLGTVYGILNALIKIGLSGQPSIDKVAGPVGEALIMTALGLLVAVPAVFAYNILLKRNRHIQDIMREFTGDLEANLIGGVRPDFSQSSRASLVTRR